MWKEDKYLITENLVKEIIDKYFKDLIEVGEIIETEKYIVTVFKVKDLQDRKITIPVDNKSYQDIKLLIFEFIKNIVIVEREVTRELLKSITKRVGVEDRLEISNINLLEND